MVRNSRWELCRNAFRAVAFHFECRYWLEKNYSLPFWLPAAFKNVLWPGALANLVASYFLAGAVKCMPPSS